MATVQPEQQVTMQPEQQPATQPTPEELATANARHLAYLEKLLAMDQFLVYGVSVGLPFSYELIQIVNHVYLADLLGGVSTDG